MTFIVADVVQERQSTSPLRNYLWYAVLPDLTSGLNNVSATYGDGVESAVDLFYEGAINHKLSTRIVNISTPFSTVETDKETDGNSFWYFAKSNDIGTINFEMYEYEDGLTLQYIQAWQNLMFNSNGTYNAPAIYKRDLKMYRLGSNKDELIQHTYKNYFISGVADIANDYEGNDIVKYAVSLTGDSVEHEIISVDFDKFVSSNSSGFAGISGLGNILSGLNIAASKLRGVTSLF